MLGRTVRRTLRIGAILAILVGVAYLVSRLARGRTPAPGPVPAPTPEPAPTRSPASEETEPYEPAGPEEPQAADEPAESAAWVEPTDGACPASHPVKGKLSSQIFHVPGGMNYDRTKADRCYATAEAAERDGFRQSKI